MISFVRSQFAHTFDSRWPNKTNWLSHTVLGIASGLAAHVISEKISDYINDLYLRRYIREGIGELMADLPCTECGLYDSGEICDFCDDLCYETVITKGPDGQDITTCIECLYQEVKELRRTLEASITETWNSIDPHDQDGNRITPPDYDDKSEFDWREEGSDLLDELGVPRLREDTARYESVMHKDNAPRHDMPRDQSVTLMESWVVDWDDVNCKMCLDSREDTEDSTVTLTCTTCQFTKVVHANEENRIPRTELRNWSFSTVEGWRCPNHSQINV